MRRAFVLAALLLSYTSVAADDNTPPFFGTVWDLGNRLITQSDPTSYRRAEYLGEHERHLLVFRDGEPSAYEMAHVFDAEYRDRHVEFQIPVSVGSSDEARDLVDVYAPIFGRLPWALRQHVRGIELHRDQLGRRCNAALYRYVDNPTYPSSGEVRCNTTNTDREVQRGFMEEIFLHEGAHVSLDPDHAGSAGWLQAQESDPTFISTYARDNPGCPGLRGCGSEDLAETFSAWFAVRYRPDRITTYAGGRDPHQEQAILDAVPARLAYLDRQHFDMRPYMRVAPVPALPLVGVLLLAALLVVAGRRSIA